MYKNYGDRNFFEYGILVDTDQTDDENVFDIIRCEPYCDEEDKYQCAQMTVDIDDDWIDKDKVMQFIGMTPETFDPIRYAIGCTEYYGWDNFGALDFNPKYDYREMDREACLDVLSGYLIDNTDLEVDA